MCLYPYRLLLPSFIGVFHLDFFLFPSLKHLFLLLIFIMCTEATQLPIEQQQQSSFFVGFESLLNWEVVLGYFFRLCNDCEE